MDHEDYVIALEQVDHLQISAASSLSLNQPLFIVQLLWIWLTAMIDDEFDLIWSHAVHGNLATIPFDPSEFVHNKVYTKCCHHLNLGRTSGLTFLPALCPGSIGCGLAPVTARDLCVRKLLQGPSEF